MIYKNEAKLYFDVVAGLKGSILVSFFWLEWLGGLEDGLMGSVYLWGLPGLLPLFLGGLPTLPCDMVCHVALWLVVDYSDQWERLWECFGGCMGFS